MFRACYWQDSIEKPSQLQACLFSVEGLSYLNCHLNPMSQYITRKGYWISIDLDGVEIHIQSRRNYSEVELNWN